MTNSQRIVTDSRRDPETEVPHSAPDKSEEVCWLLDVRKYGLETANRLHP